MLNIELYNRGVSTERNIDKERSILLSANLINRMMMSWGICHCAILYASFFFPLLLAGKFKLTHFLYQDYEESLQKQNFAQTNNTCICNFTIVFKIFKPLSIQFMYALSKKISFKRDHPACLLVMTAYGFPNFTAYVH